MGQLKDWANSKSNFLHIDPNTSVKVIYLGYQIVPSNFEKDQETCQYKLGTDEGEKLFESKANSVARAFDSVEEGDAVLIGRTGTGSNTRYTISKLEEETSKETKKVELSTPAA